jgi:tRNA-Thr(GGU) m(6)t(6)A37 methyltransferase TsaA
MLSRIEIKPIGMIHSPHLDTSKTPIQPVYSKGIRGTVEVYPEYENGLKDLEAFSHIYLIYYFHKAGGEKLIVKPYLEDVERGVFSTRAPVRPNHIGISIVELVAVKNNILTVENIDILDQTPLVDIKPYTTKFDLMENVRSGWQDGIDDQTARVRGKRGYDYTLDEIDQ